MPNWCNNHLIFIGPKDGTVALHNKLTAHVKLKESSKQENTQSWWADLEKADGRTKIAKNAQGRFFIGRTLDFDELDSGVSMEEFGYGNCISCFGTKWDPDFEVNELEFEELPEERYYLTLNLNSAWSPPARATVLIARKYGLDMELTFEEGGCDFGGRVEYTHAKNEVTSTMSDYLQWRWHEECDGDPKVVDAFIENELGEWCDEEEIKKTKDEAKGWATELPVMGPFNVDKWLEKEKGFV